MEGFETVFRKLYKDVEDRENLEAGLRCNVLVGAGAGDGDMLSRRA